MMLVLAVLIGATSRVEQEFIRWLSIAGGFLVGLVATHIVLALLRSFVVKREFPATLTQVLRLLGGIAAAVLVYLLLMPSGGDGPGGAGGSQVMSEPGNTNPQPEKPKEESKKETTPAPKKTEIRDTADTRFTVTVLGPNREKKWYQIEGETTAITEKDVLDRMALQEKNRSVPILTVQILMSKQSSAPAIEQLSKTLHSMGKTVAPRRTDSPNPPE